jgi:hypothetical protein
LQRLDQKLLHLDLDKCVHTGKKTGNDILELFARLSIALNARRIAALSNKSLSLSVPSAWSSPSVSLLNTCLLGQGLLCVVTEQCFMQQQEIDRRAIQNKQAQTKNVIPSMRSL